jgi:hypothetical protein
MSYTTEPLTALVGHLLREAEEFEKMAVRMQEKTDDSKDKTWEGLAKLYLHKARQYRRWSRDIKCE